MSAKEDPPNFLFCFGLGYSAGFLARGLAAEGWRVAGTGRDAAGAHPPAAGVAMHVFARGRPLEPAVFADASHLLVSVPPDDAGDPVL
ncbi:MAG TPA: SDR family NAD(P)-dependent oxidoreductase, partial [Stellaceae bacterium]|nr:SDR family NAD(P)-dependent oxidoreductase [Stellaceae bacterium]